MPYTSKTYQRRGSIFFVCRTDINVVAIIFFLFIRFILIYKKFILFVKKRKPIRNRLSFLSLKCSLSPLPVKKKYTTILLLSVCMENHQGNLCMVDCKILLISTFLAGSLLSF